jgi:alpha-D-ribose 1-methylphosphonate 5-triphosphate diphosphatase PhnM
MTTEKLAILWETDLLAELAFRRHGLLVQLRELGRRQLELIEQGDMTQLIHLLSAKHHLLAELQQVEKRLDPYRAQNPDSRRWRTAKLREECAEVVAKSNGLLQEILDQEKRGATSLQKHRDEAAARLQMAHSAGHARAAYATTHALAARLDVSTQQ